MTRSESPYLGLSSFSEADRALFHGRESETLELFQLVQRETLATVFGMSGLGKSSLLRAGLFPKLREASFFPIIVRLAFDGSDLVRQIRVAIEREIDVRKVDTEPPRQHQTLWEYFHRTPFWDERNRPLTPVIVFDQFEELFTLGSDGQVRKALIEELSDLVENQIPALVRRQEDASALPSNYEQPKAKVILALREEYLARLDDLRGVIPSIYRSRFRLRPMNGAQAMRAVLHEESKHLVDSVVAERIARFVAGDSAASVLDSLTIEPVLLSLVCRQLDDLRMSRNEDTISADLLKGASHRILQDFYERQIVDIAPGVIDYVEDHLLTPDGHRTTVARAVIDRVPAMDKGLRQLEERRLVRVEERLGRPHVEVIHDVLAGVMVERRAQRRRDQARRHKTRNRTLAAIVIALMVAIVGALALYVTTNRRVTADSERKRHESALKSSEVLVDEASDLLARHATWSAARILGIANDIVGGFEDHETQALVGQVTRLDKVLDKILDTPEAVTAFAFSGDGSRLVAGHTDGNLTVWDTATWKLETISLKATSSNDAGPSAVPTPDAGLDGGQKSTADAPLPIEKLALSYDGKYAAVATTAEVSVVDLVSGRRTATKDVADASQVLVSRHGDWVVVDKDGSGWSLWRTATDSFVLREMQVPNGKPCTYATTTRGEHIDTLGFTDPTKSQVPVFPGVGPTTMSLSEDGTRLATYSGFRASLWRLDNASGEPSLVATRCIAYTAGVARFPADAVRSGDEEGLPFLINYDGTCFGFPLDIACITSDDPGGEDTTALRDDAGDPVHVLRFDASRRDWMVVETDSGGALASLDGGVSRILGRDRLLDVQGGGILDLAGGDAVTLKPDGSFVAFHGTTSFGGTLPAEPDDVVRVSAPRSLAAVLSNDGFLRIWKLDSAADHVLVSQVAAVPTVPVASIHPFFAGAPTFAGDLAIARTGLLAAGAVKDLMFKGHYGSPGTETLGLFNLGENTIDRASTSPMSHAPSSKHEVGVGHVEFDRDQTKVLSLGREHRVKIWNRDGTSWLDEKKVIIGGEGDDAARIAHFSPSGARIATGARGVHTCLWDTSDGRRIACTPQDASSLALAFVDDATVAIGGSTGAIAVWSPDRNEAPLPIANLDGEIQDLAVDPARGWLASASDDGLRVWDLKGCPAGGCRPIASLDDRSAFELVRFADLGDASLVVATVHDNRLYVLDPTRPRDARALSLSGEWAASIDVLDSSQHVPGIEGTRLLACEFGGIVEEWNLETMRQTGRIELGGNPQFSWCEARYAPDGRIVTRYSDGSLSLWSRESLEVGLAGAKAGTVSSVVLSADGRQLYTHDKRGIYSIDLKTGARSSEASSPLAPVLGERGIVYSTSVGELRQLESKEPLSGARPEQTAPVILVSNVVGRDFLAVDGDLRYRLVSKDAPVIDGEVHSTMTRGAVQDAELSAAGWVVTASKAGMMTRYQKDGSQTETISLGGPPEDMVRAAGGSGLLVMAGDRVALWEETGDPTVKRFPSRSLAGGGSAWDEGKRLLLTAGFRGNECDQLEPLRRLWSDDTNYAYLPDVLTTGQLERRAVGVAASRNDLRIISLDDGKILHTFPEQAKESRTILASWMTSDERSLITFADNGSASLWDIGTEERRDQKDARWVAPGPGDQIAWIDSHGVGIRRVDGKTLRPGRDLVGCDEATRVAWSANGSIIVAMTADGRMCVWNASTGKAIVSWTSEQKGPTRLSIQADGSRVLALGADGVPKLWNAADGTLVHVFGSETLLSAAFVGATPTIATIDNERTIRLYDARQSKKLGEDITSVPVPARVLLDPSGVLVVLDDHGAGSAFDAVSGRRIRDIPSDQGSPNAIAIAPDGGHIAIASSNHVRLFARQGDKVVLDAPGVLALAFSPDSKFLATADGFELAPQSGLAVLWSVEDAKRLASFATTKPLHSVAWAKDGSKFVVGGDDGYTKIVDVFLEQRPADAVTKALEQLAPRHVGHRTPVEPLSREPTQTR